LCKYRQKKTSWYGIALSPGDGSVRFAKKVAFPWKFDGELDRMARGMVRTQTPARLSLPRAGPKLGRNDPCHCGSGKKYKKCHLTADQAG
jgi:uncharacterized protein YchJ